MTRIEHIPVQPGELIVLDFSPETIEAVAAAVPSTRRASYLQQAHLKLRRAMQAIDKADPSWLANFYNVPGPLDVDAFVATAEAFVRRHGVSVSFFQHREDIDPQVYADSAAQRSGDDFVMFEIAADDIHFVPRSLGHLDTEQLRAVTNERFTTICDPIGGLGYTFAAVSRPDSSTLINATDHSYSDGFSMMTAVWEITQTYQALAAGQPERLAELPGAESYIDYAQREFEQAARIDIEHPGMKYWVDYAFDGGGVRDGFPLPLGLEPGQQELVVPGEYDLLTGDQCAQLDIVAKEHEATFPATVYAACALTARDLAGATSYRFFNPMATRTNTEQYLAMGWYINVVPIHISLAADDDLWSVARRVRQTFRDVKVAYEVPALRVMELVKEVFGFEADSTDRPSIVSYLDGRLVPGQDQWLTQDYNGATGGGHDDDVNVWVNRMPDKLYATCSVPETETAVANVRRFFEHVGGILTDAVS